MKDFLFFCTSECDDALRDRDFYLVKNQVSEQAARDKLTAFFTENEYSDYSDYYSVFVSGVGMEEGIKGVHYNFRMTVVA